MRVFDWVAFFQERRVPYVTEGRNVSRGEINIRCPFCGSADPSHHMGLSLETGWWSCWRNRREHSGKGPIRLIMRLFNVGYHAAREMAGLDEGYVDPDEFSQVADRILGRTKPEEAEAAVTDLKTEYAGFDKITDRLRTRRHWNYLYQRGFDSERQEGADVDTLVRQYDLRAGTSGEWAGRVLIPYIVDGAVMTWTGRAIGPATVRYRDLEVARSRAAPKQILFNSDCIRHGGSLLVLVEGPIDALKLDFYGHRRGVRAVAMSTNSMSEAQAYLLQDAIGKFTRIGVMMDMATETGITDSMRMKQDLAFIPGLKIFRVPFGAKDAGDLSPQQVRRWANEPF